MTKKQLLRVTAFLLIIFMVLLVLNDMFEFSNDTEQSRRYYTYRTLKEDTVHVIFLGTSGIDRYWIPSQCYEDYGITSYPLSTDGFLPWLYPYVIDEALSKQDAKLFILDIRPFTQEVYSRKTDAIDATSRTFLDILPLFSVNRTKAAFKTMEILHQISIENNETVRARFNPSYFFSFYRYHHMWEEDNYRLQNHLGSKPHLYGGYYFNEPDVLRINEQTPAYKSDKLASLEAPCEQALYDIIEYIKEKDLNVLFLNTPQCHTVSECERANTVYKILEQEGMNYVHYYDLESESGFSIDLNVTKDFQDAGHVNFYGTAKFTKTFSDYLAEHYDLPDRRQDENAAADWEGVHDRMLKKVEKLKKEQQDPQK